MSRLGWIITAVIVMICMLHPGIRYVIWLILPFGSGWDDVIFLVAAAVVFVLLWTGRIPSNPYNRKR